MLQENKRKVLHVGLHPHPIAGVILTHYPLIEIVPKPLAERKQACLELSKATHLIFTSQTAVHLFMECGVRPLDKTYLAVGESTAQALLSYAPFSIKMAPYATGEGIVELLKELPPMAHYFFPHSARARPLIVNFLKENNLAHTATPFYDTYFKTEKPPVNIEDFDEIIFTSPSCVEAFMALYRELPKGIKLTPIGPVTESCLAQYQ